MNPEKGPKEGATRADVIVYTARNIASMIRGTAFIMGSLLAVHSVNLLEQANRSGAQSHTEEAVKTGVEAIALISLGLIARRNANTSGQ